MNVRFSNTLKSERLTDAQCVNGLQTGITKAGFEMITAARYIKGYGMLERYEGKLSRTVLRRGKASNRFSLFSRAVWLLELLMFYMTLFIFRISLWHGLSNHS